MSPLGSFKPIFAAALLAVCTASCSGNPSSGAGGGSDLSTNTVATLPEAAHRTFVDFGGKVHLLGYELSPESGGPGDTLQLKLYWKVVSRLAPGWSLFTHLEDDSARQLWNFDREGAFRGALGGAGLATLTPGKIYVDAQSLTLPKAEQLTPRAAVVVGVWLEDMRLPVVSGVTNGHEAAVIARFSTGLKRAVPQKDPNQPR